MAIEVYYCKSCAAPISYNIESKKFKCEYCFSEFEKNEIEKSSADEKGFEVDESNETPANAQLDEYNCQACGAQVLCEGNTAATFCIYCRNPSIIKSSFSGKFHPRFMIPFKITQKQAEEIYHKWIKKRFFAPSKFKNSNEIHNIKGLYAPYWLFDCRASGYISGEGRNSRSYTRGDYRITETDHYFIQRTGNCSYSKIPIDGSVNLDDELMHGIEPYNYDEIKDFAMEYMSGYLAEKYDVDETEAMKCMTPRAQDYLATTLQASGKRYQSVSIHNKNININSIKAAYSMLPVYVLTNIYNDKKHTFIINGQTGKTYGETPFDKVKLLLFSLSLFLVLWILTSLGVAIAAV